MPWPTRGTRRAACAPRQRRWGYRYALLDAGLAAEGVYLVGQARGLGVCSVGAYFEPEINDLVGAHPERYLVLHTVAIGIPG